MPEQERVPNNSLFLFLLIARKEFRAIQRSKLLRPDGEIVEHYEFLLEVEGRLVASLPSISLFEAATLAYDSLRKRDENAGE